MDILETTEITHERYSAIEIVQREDDGITFLYKRKRDDGYVYPRKGSTRWHDIRFWKTIAGAKRNSVEYLSLARGMA